MFLKYILCLLFQMYYKKFNPKCNGVMVIRFRYVLSRLSETFFPFIPPPTPTPRYKPRLVYKFTQNPLWSYINQGFNVGFYGSSELARYVQ